MHIIWLWFHCYGKPYGRQNQYPLFNTIMVYSCSLDNKHTHIHIYVYKRVKCIKCIASAWRFMWYFPRQNSMTKSQTSIYPGMFARSDLMENRWHLLLVLNLKELNGRRYFVWREDIFKKGILDVECFLKTDYWSNKALVLPYVIPCVFIST